MACRIPERPSVASQDYVCSGQCERCSWEKPTITVDKPLSVGAAGARVVSGHIQAGLGTSLPPKCLVWQRWKNSRSKRLRALGTHLRTEARGHWLCREHVSETQVFSLHKQRGSGRWETCYLTWLWPACRGGYAYEVIISMHTVQELTDIMTLNRNVCTIFVNQTSVKLAIIQENNRASALACYALEYW